MEVHPTSIPHLEDLLWEELLMVLCHRDSLAIGNYTSGLPRVVLFFLKLGHNDPSLGRLVSSEGGCSGPEASFYCGG